MKMRKKQMGAVAVNNLIGASRVFLCILVFGMLFGIVWSAGSMRFIEYFLLTVLVVSSSIGLYIRRPKNNNRNLLVEKLSFYLGLAALVGSILLNIFGFIRSPDLIFLFLLFFPYVGVYVLQDNSK